MTSPGHETAPLTENEQRTLQHLAQQLIRTDPHLLRTPTTAAGPPGRGFLAGTMLLGCLAVGVLAMAISPAMALAAGAAVLTVMVTVVATRSGMRGRSGTPRR